MDDSLIAAQLSLIRKASNYSSSHIGMGFALESTYTHSFSPNSFLSPFTPFLNPK
jgi:hypothetical protein